jgi:hypothetical protein
LEFSPRIFILFDIIVPVVFEQWLSSMSDASLNSLFGNLKFQKVLLYMLHYIAIF